MKSECVFRNLSLCCLISTAVCLVWSLVWTYCLLQLNQSFLTAIRAECTYKDDGSRICGEASHGYSTSISDTNKDANVIISGSWTRGLAVHPVGKPP